MEIKSIIFLLLSCVFGRIFLLRLYRRRLNFCSWSFLLWLFSIRNFSFWGWCFNRRCLFLSWDRFFLCLRRLLFCWGILFLFILNLSWCSFLWSFLLINYLFWGFSFCLFLNRLRYNWHFFFNWFRYNRSFFFNRRRYLWCLFNLFFNSLFFLSLNMGNFLRCIHDWNIFFYWRHYFFNSLFFFYFRSFLNGFFWLLNFFFCRCWLLLLFLDLVSFSCRWINVYRGCWFFFFLLLLFYYRSAFLLWFILWSFFNNCWFLINNWSSFLFLFLNSSLSIFCFFISFYW